MDGYTGPINKPSDCRPYLDPAYYNMTDEALQAAMQACLLAAAAAGCPCEPELKYKFSHTVYCFWTPPPENFPGGNVSIYVQTLDCNQKKCDCPVPSGPIA